MYIALDCYLLKIANNVLLPIATPLYIALHCYLLKIANHVLSIAHCYTVKSVLKDIFKEKVSYKVNKQ